MKILHIIGGSFEDGTLKGACNLHNKSKEFGVKSKILNNDIKNIIYIKKRHKIGKYYSAFLSLFIYKDIIYNPKLYLSIAAYRPVSVYVHGEVNKPGLYTLNYTTRGSTINRKSESAILAYDIAMPSLSPKVFDAIKEAAGVTQNADLSNIKIIRKNSQSQG